MRGFPLLNGQDFLLFAFGHLLRDAMIKIKTPK